MAGGALDGREGRRIGKKSTHGPGLGQIILPGAGAVQIDIVDINRTDTGITKGQPHGGQSARSPGMGRGRMMGVTGKACPHKLGQGIFERRVRQQHHGRTLGHGHALPVFIQGMTAVTINELQGVETEIGQAAQGIHPADQDAFRPSHPQHAQGQGQGNRPG